MFRSLPFAAILAIGTAAAAHDYTAGPLAITHPYIPATTSATAGGYLAIINTGTEADSLVGITAGFATSAMLHASSVDASGVARMTHLDALPIGPGETVRLEPGALHVMFMGVTAPLVAGTMLPATLTFEHAGAVEVEFKVEPRGAAHDHAPDAPTN